MLRVANRVSLFLYVDTLLLVTALGAGEPATDARPLPTDGESRVLEALGRTIDVDFGETPLGEVVFTLKDKLGIDVQLDNRALADAGVGSDAPVTIGLKGIRGRSALRLALHELDLTYVVRDGYLLITSLTEAENMLRVKVYPVRDLVALESEFCPTVPPNRRIDDDYGSLCNLILSVVSPTSWEGSGPGPIRAFAKSHSITISQTQDIHEDVADLLAALRRVRDEQIAAAKAVPRPLAPQAPAKGDGLRMSVYRLLPWHGQAPWLGLMGGGMGGGMFMVADQDAAAQDAKPTEQSPAPSATNPPKSEARSADGLSAASAAALSYSWDERHLDDWAKELASSLPRLIEPASWEPRGDGSIEAVAGAIVVRQTPEVQQKVAQFLAEILPGRVVMYGDLPTPAGRLPVPEPQLNWPQRAEPPASANEARIEEALGMKCDAEFREKPFVDAIHALAAQGEIKPWIDKKALTDAGVANDTPITRSMRGVTLRTALKLVLGELDLTYVIRNEALMITSQTEAENLLVTKVYPVFDLVASEPAQFARAARLGSPVGSPGNPRPFSNFNSLIDNITTNISPSSWDEIGGPGAIKEFVNAGALVVSHTTETHEEIAAYLRALREVAVAQR